MYKTMVTSCHSIFSPSSYLEQLALLLVPSLPLLPVFIMSNNIWFLPSTSQPPVDVNNQSSGGTASSSSMGNDHPLVEPELSLADLPDSDVSLSQPSSPQSRHRYTQPLVHDILEPPTQRRRLTEPMNFGRPGTSPRHPGPPLYPPFPSRVPLRPDPTPSNRNEVGFIGDLLYGQARVLGQFLWVGRTEEGGPVRYFEATYEGPNDDHYWGLVARPIPPQEGVSNWGHNRWLLGHPKELTEDQLAAHVGDMTQRTLRFLHLP